MCVCVCMCVCVSRFVIPPKSTRVRMLAVVASDVSAQQPMRCTDGLSGSDSISAMMLFTRSLRPRDACGGDDTTGAVNEAGKDEAAGKKADAGCDRPLVAGVRG
jgi:hypothetical protein